MNRIRNAALCVALAVASLPGMSLAQVTIPLEYGKTIKTAEAIAPLGNGMFGDETNFYTGATTFVATDVSLPGNNALPVALGRRLAVGSHELGVPYGDGMWKEWDLDIPHLEGVFAASEGWAVQNLIIGQGWGDPQKRCSASGLVQPVTATGSFGGLWYGSDYWQGYQMYVPGAGSQELLRISSENPNKPTDGKDYKWLTAGNWFVSCLSTTANGYPGEGFLAVSPDGVRYYFDWFASREAAVVIKPLGSGGEAALKGNDSPTPALLPVGNSTSLSRVEVWIMPTRVEDRFGNYVTYTYDAANPWRLTKISSSDGRTLNVAYNTSGRIASVTDGTRTWTYVYGTTFQVNLPDGTKWTYSGMPVAARIEPEADSNIIDFCARSGGNAVQPIYTATITHPSGAIGTFRFQSRLHGRSYVNNVCVKPVNSNAGHAKFPYLFDAIGLIDKTITGFGIPANTKWTYTYGATNQSWLQNCPNDSCTGTKTSEVTGPEGWTRYTFSNRWQHSEGKLLKVEQGSSPTNILRTESTTYLMDPTSQRYPLVIGINPNDRGDSTTEVLLPVVKRQILQQVRLFTWQIGAVGGVYDFDSFGRPTKITRSSAPSP